LELTHLRGFATLALYARWPQTIVPWIFQDRLWERIVVVTGTSAIRTFLWSTVKKINSSKREYGFWAGGIIGGTMIFSHCRQGKP
jgi:hypothetical protein